MPFEEGKKVSILAEFIAEEGKLEDLTKLLREHARLCLEQEEGCLRFEVLHPISRQGTAVANQLILNELYADEEAIDIHETTDRMQAILPNLKALATDIKITYSIVE